ncbi:TPA_exp: Uncharacterized protein A8136_5647 [Trichophyton benhamiae CBS 112371]|nr:TPA_exp: Uncharacterized protein A8136_5647 [Trichophyton benhamiae CBS 112371]
MSRPPREAPSEVLNPPGQLVPFVYEGLCGVRHPGVNGGDGLKFTFAEFAPRAICLPGFGHTPESAHLACRFVANLAARHHADLLAMRSWDCQFCGIKASTFNLVVVSFLSPEAGTVDPIRRSVWGYGVPICRTAGSCDQKAGRLTAELRDTYISGLATPPSPSCMMCGSTEDLMLCSGCKVVRYCSLECRREHHSVHKKDCRAAQREKLRDKIQEHLLRQRESHFSKFKRVFYT